ncbi:MAG: T9SS type A sorting domain-containing protein [Bacteroidales bacterium]|nr:T9SS type A sorting domain-containing protein [Bacteroidales bacterium]
MKKLSLLIVMFLMTSLMGYSQEWYGVSKNTPVKIQETLVSSTEKEILVDVKVEGFFAEKVETPQGQQMLITAEDMATMLVKGAPSLPMYPISMIIDDKAEMEVSIVKSNYVDFENIEVAPSKGNFSRQINPDDVEYVYGEMYQQNAFYPAQQAALETPYILRDFRAQNLMVYPYAYNHVTKTLRVYTNLRIAVKKVSDNGINQKQNRRDNRIVADQEVLSSYKHRFINFQKQDKYDFIEDEGEMLVICVNEYMDALQELVTWKNMSGRPTTMVPVSETGTLDAMKSYISEYYQNNPNLTSVLLVGEYDNIPPYSVTVSEGLIAAKSDNYYGMLEGNDFYEEVFIGRLSVASATDAANQVNKIIYYERDIDESATWLSKGVGIGSTEGNGHFGERDYQHIDFIRDTLMNYTYTQVAKIYEGVDNFYPDANDVAFVINDGVGIANYCNHGTQTSWVVSNFTTQDVNNLTNDNMLPFIWSSACYNGEFSTNECFAESWLRSMNESTGAPAGAIGGMFSWISQPWIPPMYGQDEMVNILTEWRDGYKHTLGGASLNGNMCILDMSPDDNGDTHNTWILFGDPSLMLRTEAPKAINVECDNNLYVGVSEMIVKADAEQAIATLSVNGEMLSSVRISNGQARLSFPALTETGKATLVVMGYNKTTVVKEIEIVTIDGSYVVCNNVELNQADGQADFGETLDITMNVKNIGNVTANNVNVEIISNSEYAYVVDGNTTISSIEAGSSDNIENVFRIFVANNVPDQTVLDFTVKCSTSSDTWTSTFNITANAPKIEIVSVALESDDVLNPGDNASLKIEISNNGNSDASNVITEMFSSSSDITFDVETVETEKIEAAQTIVLTADFNIASSVSNGAIYEVAVSVASGFYVAEANHFINVGQSTENFETGNFNSFNWQFDGDAEWTITGGAQEGSYCAVSGDINDGQSTSLKLVVEFPYEDVISFYRKLHCDYYDKLFFLVDGQQYAMWQGNNSTAVPWEQFTYTIPQGTHTLEWKYKKDGSDSFGSDCVYVDEIALPSANVVTSMNAVENLTAKVDVNNVTLTWEAADADEYIIRRDGEQIATVTETTFAETLEDGIHTYNIVARKGNQYSLPAFIAVELGNFVNVNEIEYDNVEVYPNPTSGMLYVKINRTFDAIVYNYQGQIVKKLYDNNAQIDLSELNYGIYFVEIRTNEGVTVKKVLVK